MKSKIKNIKRAIPSPFESVSYKTEWTCAAKLCEWIDEITKKKDIPFGKAEVETTTEGNRKRADIIIYESPTSQRVAIVVETKQPFWDVFAEEFKKDARDKANKRKSSYFATCNFRRLIWWKTKEANNPTLSEEQQIADRYIFSEIEDLNDIEQSRYSEPIKRKLEEFLTKLYAVYSGKEPEPKQAIDETLIFRLQEKIKVLSIYYKRIIDDQSHKDSSFARKLKNWFIEQGWGFTWQPQDFDKVARQTAYLLVNKILFYSALQRKRPQELEPLEIPESLFKGESLQAELQKYFKQVLKIDYETIYTADFIDDVAFPEAKEVVREIKELINIFKKYDFSTLGYDILGRTFERLIPQDERHNLGQYFTNADVVDLILSFCLHHEDDKLLDPACGAGTFLVRAYQHKKLMNQRLEHEKILDTLWGNDIAKFPATLATINLAINDLAVDKNYPNILQEDFFALLVGDKGFDPDRWRKTRAKTLGLGEREVTYPRWFDLVVGNPPYTRQEEIAEISPKDLEYKVNLIKKALLDIQGKKIAEIGKRAGIHAYFFIHGTKFLKDGGHFGFIVSNSWLDVDYGKGLQEFFLKNYKIVAIIESKVERWFEQADINTCIIILQKCKDKKERDENLVRFVYLKKPLRDFIPPAQDMWEKQVERLNAIDKLKKTILGHNEFYENEELRIYPKSQKELWEEGLEDVGEGFCLPKKENGGLKTSATKKPIYVGSKWGKYLRAPEIFFKILLKGKGKLVPLKEVARVRRGFTTGANEFFYLTEEQIMQKGIEKEFWMHKDDKGKWTSNKVIVSPRECTTVTLEPDKLKKIVLFINKDEEKLKGKNVLSYITSGKRRKINKRPTCSSRNNWYELEFREPWPILYPMIHKDRQLVISNKYKIQVDHNLFEVKPRRKRDVLPLLCFLLSTISMLFKEFYGRTYGGGTGPVKTEGIDVERLPVIKSFSKEVRRKLRKLTKKNLNPEVKPIFKDLQAYSSEKVIFDKIRTDRRELDKIIMGEILGLTDEEQLEVYRAVVDLVKSRIEKAKSVEKANKIVEGINVDALKRVVVEKLKSEAEE